MQIIIALHLLLALSAVHLPLANQPMDAATHGLCVSLAMLMSIILCQTLITICQNYFSPAANSEATETASYLADGSDQLRVSRSWLSPDWLAILVWSGFSLVVTFVFDWTHFAGSIGEDIPLLGQAITLAPHLICLVLMWSLGDWNYSQASLICWNTWLQIVNRLSAKFQMLLLPILLPILAVYSVRAGLTQSAAWHSLPTTTQAIALSFSAMAVLLLTYPWLLSRLWTTEQLSQQQPMESNRLNAIATKLRLRISGVDRWNTRLRIANAAVVGWMPGVRRVLISDVLLRILTPNELTAVFLHEAGHIRRSHSLWRLTTVLLPMQLLLIGFSLQEKSWFGESLFGSPTVPTIIVAAIALFVASAALLSWFSKQLELEADRYAWQQQPQFESNTKQHCDSTIDSAQELGPLVSAILKTARVTETSIHQPALFHPTTAKRMREICRLQTDSGYLQVANRRLSLTKQWLITVFLLTTSGLVLSAWFV